MATSTRLQTTSTVDSEDSAGRRTVARAMRIGMWIWPLFTILDTYMCFVAYPSASFTRFLAYRAAVLLLFYAVYRASRGKTVELKRLFWLQNVTYGTAALTIAVMGVELGGIRSPYMHGISIVALVRATLVPTEWRSASRRTGGSGWRSRW